VQNIPKKNKIKMDQNGSTWINMDQNLTKHRKTLGSTLPKMERFSGNKRSIEQ
jgi:hypothetical protein